MFVPLELVEAVPVGVLGLRKTASVVDIGDVSLLEAEGGGVRIIESEFVTAGEAPQSMSEEVSFSTQIRTLLVHGESGLAGRFMKQELLTEGLFVKFAK